MNWIGFAVFGLVVGAIAKFLTPGRDPGGCIITMLLGVAGSLLGGWLSRVLLGNQGGPAGWLGSIVGTVILLLIWRMLAGGRSD
jgi:uncharacterized membrane protein YeaQ/YmgE (transglycosylase-associated protein family)